MFALGHDIRVAEAAFARVAKNHFRRQLCHKSKLVDAAFIEGHTIWVLVHEVSIHASMIPSNPTEETPGELLLRNVVDRLAIALNDTVEEETEAFLLLGPLSVGIKQVAKEIFMFSVKQRWAID
jgi:hypothetical protein